jgi:hypothetical protein
MFLHISHTLRYNPASFHCAAIRPAPLAAWEMFEKLRKFFQTGAGVATAGALVVIALLVLIFSLRSAMTSDAEDMAAHRVYIDSTTMKPFNVTLKPGLELPCKAPSGGMTGYPAEACWWTRDGKIRSEPFYVLLKQTMGKPGPTFCPDCGRLVVGHNPAPKPGSKPPPTEAEYRPRGR